MIANRPRPVRDTVDAIGRRLRQCPHSRQSQYSRPRYSRGARLRRYSGVHPVAPLMSVDACAQWTYRTARRMISDGRRRHGRVLDFLLRQRAQRLSLWQWTKLPGRSRHDAPECKTQPMPLLIRRSATRGTPRLSREQWPDGGQLIVSEFVTHALGAQCGSLDQSLMTPSTPQCCLRQSWDCRRSRQCPLSGAIRRTYAHKEFYRP